MNYTSEFTEHELNRIHEQFVRLDGELDLLRTLNVVLYSFSVLTLDSILFNQHI